MKSIINRNKKNITINKTINNHRHSSTNIDLNNKISNLVLTKKESSMFKMNKTIQKYINEKLSELKENIQPNKTSKQFSRNINNNHHNIHPTKNLSFNKITRNKSIKLTKKNKGRNNKHNDSQLFQNDFRTSELYFKFNDFPKLINNNNNKNDKNNKKDYLANKINKEINNIIKSPKNEQTTKGKLVKDFYQNYLSPMSMSTGISLNNNNEIIYKENNKNKIGDNNTINSNNNYEADSLGEDSMHEIIFKGINKGSPITFGNSFSYTNSKRNSNSKNQEQNDDEKYKIDKSVLLLKCQNETLRKELKESNLQISFLKNEIKKLVKIKKMNITNYKYNVNIKNKKLDIYPKGFSKNSSYLNNLYYDNDKFIDKSNYNSDFRINKENNNNNKYYKMKLLNKNKLKAKYRKE